MKTSVIKQVLKILIILSPLLLFAVMYVGAGFFQEHNSYSTCITYRFFGVYCPGCGMTRSVIALMNGDILLSIRQNAMIVTTLVIGMIFYVWYILGLFGVKFKLIICNLKFLYGILAIWFIYGISRNFIPSIAPI